MNPLRQPSKQFRVLRLLHAHRYLDVAQLTTLGFPDASRRACQACLTKLFRKGYVHRFELAHGGLGGGRTSYVYALAVPGAQVLAEAARLPLVDIVCAPDPPSARAVFVNHQLAANRCLVAVWRALESLADGDLLRWTSDPHTRLRYRPAGGRHYRVVHPDVIATLRLGAYDHWSFIEIDRGTQELARYGQKVMRYARFLVSDAWTTGFPVFPALRVVSISAARAASMRVAVADAIDRFDHHRYRRLRDLLHVATTSESELLTGPLGPIWRPAFGARDARHAWYEAGAWTPARRTP